MRLLNLTQLIVLAANTRLKIFYVCKHAFRYIKRLRTLRSSLVIEHILLLLFRIKFRAVRLVSL